MGKKEKQSKESSGRRRKPKVDEGNWRAKHNNMADRPESGR